MNFLLGAALRVAPNKKFIAQISHALFKIHPHPTDNPMRLSQLSSLPAIPPCMSPRSLGMRLCPTRSAIAVLACAISLVSCGDPNRPTGTNPPSPSPGADVASPTPTPPSPDPATVTEEEEEEELSDLEPVVGTITAIVPGDLMCYITYTDETGQEFQEGATFELCEQPDQYLNQRVRLIYGIRNVNDCTSSEPCGKTRRTHLIIQMDPIDDAGRTMPLDAVVFSDGDWTITIGNRNSWSGVNGTGNLTYRGCNAAQDCIDLTNGVMTCRDGLCSSTWRNGAYTYTLESPITDGSTEPPSTLTVRRGEEVLTEISGLIAL